MANAHCANNARSTEIESNALQPTRRSHETDLPRRANVLSPYLIHRRPECKKQKQAEQKEQWTKIEKRYLTTAFKDAREAAGCYADWKDEEMQGFHEVWAPPCLCQSSCKVMPNPTRLQIGNQLATVFSTSNIQLKQERDTPYRSALMALETMTRQ